MSVHKNYCLFVIIPLSQIDQIWVHTKLHDAEKQMRKETQASLQMVLDWDIRQEEMRERERESIVGRPNERVRVEIEMT